MKREKNIDEWLSWDDGRTDNSRENAGDNPDPSTSVPLRHFYNKIMYRCTHHLVMDFFFFFFFFAEKFLFIYKIYFFFCGGRDLNVRPCMYYALSLPTELISQWLIKSNWLLILIITTIFNFLFFEEAKMKYN